MLIKTIHVSYTRKLNLGDYDSVALEAGAWADLEKEEGTIPEATKCFNELSEVCKLNVRERSVPFFRPGQRHGEATPRTPEDLATYNLANPEPQPDGQPRYTEPELTP